MKKKLLKLINAPFIRNVIIMITGTAAAQVMGLLLSPIITRLYGPEAYGLMGTFTAIISLIIPIAALTYPVAIVLPKHNSDAIGLARLSLLISLFVSLLIGVILIIFHNPIIDLFQIEDIAPYLFLIPIVIFLAGLLQVTEQWLIRTKQFSISARATFLQATTVYGGQVAVGLFYPIASVLIFFTALKQGIKAILILLLVDKPNDKSKSKDKNKYTSIKELAKNYKDFPLYRAPQAFVNSISMNIPILILANFFGPASVGFYNIARTVLSVPTQLIGKSVGDVFYPRITEVANQGQRVTGLIKKMTLILGAVGIVPYGIIIVFGPTLFSFVFGSDWLVAGEYARWIALWNYTSFILQPAVRALPVLSAQRFHLIYTIFSLIIRLAMLALGYLIFSNDIIAIGLFSITSGILNIILILITVCISKKFNSIKP